MTEKVVRGPKPTSYTVVAVVERKNLDPVPKPRPHEKVAIELPFRDWERVQDCLNHLTDIYQGVGVKAATRTNVDKAMTSLELGYNKTTGRWDLG